MTRKWSLVIFVLVINVKFWHNVNNWPKYPFLISCHSPLITMFMKFPTSNHQHHHMMILLPFSKANVENWLSLKKLVLPWYFHLLPLSPISPSHHVLISFPIFRNHNIIITLHSSQHLMPHSSLKKRKKKGQFLNPFLSISRRRHFYCLALTLIFF
jgi:hypothetical protein